ncbi:hypothetical protein E8E12_011082 [Didymella heteroderae]|uniref:Uncharacterized protein n=1 Tax=Didymella heteroderae TaxID=1769908 RepID=A0A9P5C4U0_9PLEO|nr:hypothetical protein E8E12_011082 [Didymella heteroderae]
MDVLSNPVWPEEPNFSSPSSVQSTGSPGHADDVPAILAAESKLKRKWEKASNTVKRYVLPPGAAYAHWEACAPRSPAKSAETVESDSNAASVSKITPLLDGNRDSPRSSEDARFLLSEWRLVGEYQGKRVWVNAEGVRVREEDSLWASFSNRVKKRAW